MKNNANHTRYEVGEWKNDSIKTFIATVFIAGDYNTSLNCIRDYCFPSGACFSIRETTYIYAGGAESGIEVTLFQYPPFPDEEKYLLDKCIEVGTLLAEKNFQWSFSIVCNDKTHFFSRRRG